MIRGTTSRWTVIALTDGGPVLYAAYGSNLLRDRLMCYIEGGRPEGADCTFPGCTDRTPPPGYRPVRIPHDLLFTGDNEIWGGAEWRSSRRSGGLGPSPRPDVPRHLRAVRPGRQAGERGRPGRRPHRRDPDTAAVHGTSSIVGAGWYDLLVHLGDAEGHPVLTFTSRGREEVRPNPPGERYLRTIVRGLIETHSLQRAALADYLLGPGISRMDGVERGSSA